MVLCTRPQTAQMARAFQPVWARYGRSMQESRKAQKQRVQQTRQQAAENNPDAPSPEMFRALMAALTERGCKEREEYLAELSGFFGREVKSSKELTTAEISEYLNACNGAAQYGSF